MGIDTCGPHHHHIIGFARPAQLQSLVGTPPVYRGGREPAPRGSHVAVCHTVGYGGVAQELNVKLQKRTIGSDYQNTITLEMVQTLRNESTIAAFNDAVHDSLSALDTDIFWMRDNMLLPPSKRNIRTGFGLKVILSAASTSYYHEGVNSYVYAGDSVMSCLPGKVVYVGETTLSGKTVIVEHGGGLKSLYAHLSVASVRVGDYIQKGHSIGIVGNTGFCTGTTLHFGLYVFDVPVRYYNYESDGVSLAKPVAEALGLLKKTDET